MSRYEITIEGVAGPVVLAALEGFTDDRREQGRSRLVGEVVDQAALHGILARLEDLRVEIVAIRRLRGASPAPPREGSRSDRR